MRRKVVSESQLGPETPGEGFPQPVEPRNPLGWIALALLFAFLILGAASRKESTDPEERRAAYAARLKTALALRQAGSNPLSKVLSGSDSPDDELRDLERDTAKRRQTAESTA
ncbi:hypothetical protein EON82_15630, partial [bacterium]